MGRTPADELPSGRAGRLRHVHLIGHSAGCWVVNEAARRLAEQSAATVHLTFLDAYVPHGWNRAELGAIEGATCWAEHYLTRDRLGGLTEHVLPHAHNVDVTAVNPGFNSHTFPWHWYHATVCSAYRSGGRFAGHPVVCQTADRSYGFARSLEAGRTNWDTSVGLPKGYEPATLGPRD